MKSNFTEKEIKTINLHMKRHPTSMMVGENKWQCQYNRFCSPLYWKSAFVASLVIISGKKPFDVLFQGVYMTNIPFEAVCLLFCFFRIWALGVLWGWCLCNDLDIFCVLGPLVSLLQALIIWFPEVEEKRQTNHIEVESRGQNRRTWSSLLSQIHKKYIHVEQSSQNTYWMPAEDRRHPDVQERSPRNEIGWKKKRSSSSSSSSLLEGSCERGQFPSPWEAPSPVGTCAGTETELQRLGGECSSQFAADKTETCTEDLCSLAAVLSPRRVPAGVCGFWVLKRGLQRTDRGSGLGLATRRQPEGAGVWYVPNLGCMRKKTRLAIEAKHHCWGAGEGRGRSTTAASFLVPPLRQPLGAHKCQQVAHTWRWGWNQSGSPGTAWLRKQGWYLTPLPMAVQFADLCHCHWLNKLSACGTSEWTVGTPMAGMGPALVAVGFVGTGTWRLGWAGV